MEFLADAVEWVIGEEGEDGEDARHLAVHSVV